MPSVNQTIGEADLLSSHLQSISEALFPPTSQKFPPGEAGRLMGVFDSTVRKMSLAGEGPQPEPTSNGRRLYTLSDIDQIWPLLAQSTRVRGGIEFTSHRRPGEHLQVLAVINFKGGSGKTTTSAHLAQYLALQSYRVLAGDLDPQASLSAISAMGSSLHEKAENAKLAIKLQQQFAEGEAVISIETASIQSSKIVGRITIDVDPAFDASVASIAEHRQQVPILVRPNLQASARFQITDGHRRVKAAEKPSRPVRAIIRNLSDGQLYITQGRGNLDRKNVTFIEKAFFAKNVEDRGCDRPTIIAALTSDKADVSRYVAIARQVPCGLFKLIGPAPKAGRARWYGACRTFLPRQSSNCPQATRWFRGEQIGKRGWTHFCVPLASRARNRRREEHELSLDIDSTHTAKKKALKLIS
ncbi:plasmid partitioning protein RepB (plasmid) [Rhizobium sp. CB3171]|uniref:plasmid partitioning protein RepB n=1 Tax=Rhizobium sp. CB3171 TaxID=3039157 RepID=UPI0024B10670|nr:plasmid partitioning protein RepB [Rhizobium sp. CB3171]WFU07307.1 plasmid partitioning protein RepB [Rhizobium sp. CB3171]